MKTANKFSSSEKPNILLSVEERLKRIELNLKKQKCFEFISSVPESKCANCGKHYLSHTNKQTHERNKF
jgi:rRNA maturation endonuclease Nob1